MDQDLKSYLDGKFGGLDGKFAEMETRFDGKFAEMETRFDGKFAEMGTRFDGKLTDLENRLVEKMRDMQTELLRGFESFSVAQTLRLRKVEADQSNLDTSLRGRMDVVENRLLQIEFRLGKASSS